MKITFLLTEADSWWHLYTLLVSQNQQQRKNITSNKEDKNRRLKDSEQYCLNWSLHKSLFISYKVWKALNSFLRCERCFSHQYIIICCIVWTMTVVLNYRPWNWHLKLFPILKWLLYDRSLRGSKFPVSYVMTVLYILTAKCKQATRDAQRLDTDIKLQTFKTTPMLTWQ